ncbi:MAG: hypothetical protein AAF197_08470 [Pseudomonadota bacterium]
MNKDQRNLLQKYLELGDENLPSDESEAIILAAARKRAERNKVVKQKARIAALNKNGLKLVWHPDFFQNLSTATLAVIFTVSLFYGLHQIVGSDHTLDTADQGKHNNSFIVLETNPTNSSLLGSRFEKPTRNISLPPELATMYREIKQLDPADIIEIPNLGTDEDKMFTKQLVAIALADIGEHIAAGDLLNAQERYQRLLADCGDCELPATLEQLASLSASINTRG